MLSHIFFITTYTIMPPFHIAIGRKSLRSLDLLLFLPLFLHILTCAKECNCCLRHQILITGSLGNSAHKQPSFVAFMRRNSLAPIFHGYATGPVLLTCIRLCIISLSCFCNLCCCTTIWFNYCRSASARHNGNTRSCQSKLLLSKHITVCCSRLHSAADCAASDAVNGVT